MGTSTEFGNDHTGVEQMGAVHVCDGSIVTLVGESAAARHLARVAAFPGLKIRANRTATEINFEWQFKETTWQPFASDGVFTVASGTAATAWCIDP